LIRLLAADAVAYGDGGGKAITFPSPVFGRERVAQLFVELSRLGLELKLRVRPTQVNGQPGALFTDPEGRLITVVSLDIADDQVQAIRSVSNPEKLRHLGPLADTSGLLREPGGPSIPDLT